MGACRLRHCCPKPSPLSVLVLQRSARRWRTPTEVSSSRFPSEIRWSRSRETLAGAEGDEIGKGKFFPLASQRNIGPPVKLSGVGGAQR
jgi:hypothetical protein